MQAYIPKMEVTSLKHQGRPFPGAHWALWVVLLALWAVSLYTTGSGDGSRYLAAILATLTICIAFWTNHFHVGHVRNIGNLAKVVAGALSDLFVFFLLLIVIAIAVPNIDGNPSKANAYRLFSIADPIRTEIGKRFEQRKTLNGVGSGLNIDFAGNGNVTGVVTDDGIIIVTSEKPAAALILQPVIGNKELSWKCLEYPKRYACHFAEPAVK